ncbi:universal stress protein [Brachybacterium sp. GCM10030252]|uniref:universal stress protein n=1 Tax=Brachybacterium sp. GCM10030252 TaxID=3273380 RepID=UPI003605EE7B
MDFTASIVVGYDDTTASAGAVRWAAELARDTRRPLRLVHAWTLPMLGHGMAGVPVMDPAGPRNQALRVLDDAVDAVSDVTREIAVTTELLPGNPRDVLGEVSVTADLLVVGTRGLGAVMSTLLGSVSRGILHDAGCPVAIIRSDQHRAGPVLAAVDGSEAGQEAVDAASDLAAAWGTALRIVHVRAGGAAADADGLLEAAVQRARGRHDGITVDAGLLEGRSVPDALLTAAAGARILVMGHRGVSRGPFGSTAHATLLHATGNVMVARQCDGSGT